MKRHRTGRYRISKLVLKEFEDEFLPRRKTYLGSEVMSRSAEINMLLSYGMHRFMRMYDELIQEKR